MLRPQRIPIVLRMVSGKPLALCPTLPWGLDTMGAYSPARGWHEAAEALCAKGRPCNEQEALTLLKEVQGTLGAGETLVPQSRVGAATHEARKTESKGA